jgi:hypothetical protein
MTEEQLKEIEDRANAATHGPWRGARSETDADEWWSNYPNNALECLVVTDEEHIERIDEDDTMDLGYKSFPICCTNDDGLAIEQESKNAIFIANARTDVPLLIAEIRRLRNLVEKQRFDFGAI